MNHSPPRIVFLNRCYWPDSEATGQLLCDLCAVLTDAFDVHVVCGQPNSPTTDQFTRIGVEERCGVTIHRLAHTQFAKHRSSGRLLNHLSFAVAAGRYLRSQEMSADILVAETDPFLLPIVAARHAHRVGCRLVCYLQDIYPDVAEALGKVSPGLVTRAIRSKLRNAYRDADRVVVLGDCMRDRLHAPPWSLPLDDILVIPNWADCDAIEPKLLKANRFRRQHGLEDRFIVMHSGNMGLTQRLDTLVEAADCSDWPEAAVLVLIGDGASRHRLEQRAKGLQSDRVRFFPYQARADLADSLSAADLHVVSMHERITGCLCPSKLYGILAAARPVLAIADPSTDLCRTVTGHQLGWCCLPGDVRDIANSVAAAADDTIGRLEAGTRARQLARRQFDRKVVTRRFADMLTELIPMPSATVLHPLDA